MEFRSGTSRADAFLFVASRERCSRAGISRSLLERASLARRTCARDWRNCSTRDNCPLGLLDTIHTAWGQCTLTIPACERLRLRSPLGARAEQHDRISSLNRLAGLADDEAQMVCMAFQCKRILSLVDSCRHSNH